MASSAEPLGTGLGSGGLPDADLDGGDVVELRLPARPDLLVLARLITAGVGARSGFDVDELDDLRLAVDELCLSATESRCSGPLELRLMARDGELLVSCSHRVPVGGGGPTAEPEEAAGGAAAFPAAADLSERILDALVDEHGRERQGDRVTAWFRKRRAGRGAGHPGPVGRPGP